MKFLLNLTRFRLGLAALLLVTGSIWAQTPAAAPATPPPPTAEERIAALEAYVTNVDPAKGPLVGAPGPGHNAWMMTSAALVLFMTLPGLALFYGGLVRKKNVLSVLAQCLGIAGMVTIMWWAFGYSFVFGKSFGSPFLGGSEYFFLKGVTSAPNTDYAYWVSQNVFSMYQMMFAIITPALIVGAIAERVKFSAWCLFAVLWATIVYNPVCHWVWNVNGWLFQKGVLDFAGGTVVHVLAGVSALALLLILPKRRGYPGSQFVPHSVGWMMMPLPSLVGVGKSTRRTRWPWSLCSRK
jgi:Amt family ammonium transporter